MNLFMLLCVSSLVNLCGKKKVVSGMKSEKARSERGTLASGVKGVCLLLYSVSSAEGCLLARVGGDIIDLFVAIAECGRLKGRRFGRRDDIKHKTYCRGDSSHEKNIDKDYSYTYTRRYSGSINIATHTHFFHTHRHIHTRIQIRVRAYTHTYMHSHKK